MAGLFDLDFVELHIAFSNVFAVVLLLSLFVLIYYINNIPDKGKSVLRLIDNIPLFISGFIFFTLMEISQYMLVVEGMSIYEYGSSISQDILFQCSFVVIVLMMTFNFCLKLRKSNKKKVVLK